MSDLEFRILGSGDEDVLKRFLVPRLDSSLFLYSNMMAAGLEDTGGRYSGTYAAAFEDGEMLAVAGHFWNQTVVFQAPEYPPELMQLARRASERPLKRLVGPNEQVSLAIEALALGAADMQMDEPEKLYSLSLDQLVVPALLTSGKAHARRIRAEDEDLVTAWRAGYYRELHLEKDNQLLESMSRRNVQSEIASGQTWILEVAGEPVSCTSFNANVRDEGIAGIVQVGGVYTPPEHRGRGFARAIVAASLLDARSEGFQKSVLFTGISNVAAQRAYEALGYCLIGSYRISVLRQAILDLG